MNRFGSCRGGGRRSAVRQAAPLMAVFTTVTQSHTAALVDVSRTGARLRGDRLPAKGEDMLLSIDSVRAFGSVAWSRGDQCGVAFDEPLGADELRLLRAKIAPGLPPEVKAALDDWTLGLAR